MLDSGAKLASPLYSPLNISVKPDAGTSMAPAEVTSIEKAPKSFKMGKYMVGQRSPEQRQNQSNFIPWDQREMVVSKAHEAEELQVTQTMSMCVKVGSASSCNMIILSCASEDDELQSGGEFPIFRDTVNGQSFRESLGSVEISLRKLFLGELVWLPATSTGNIFLELLNSFPQKSPEHCSRKKLLVLDINGLLADIVHPAPKGYKADTKIAGRAVFRRPCCSDFLNFCLERFDVAIWSSRSKKIVDRVVQYLFGDLKHKLVFCWDLSYCTESKFRTLENRHKVLVFKELRKIWEKCDPDLPWEMGDYDESNTLLLDDSPYKALLNPPDTAIFPFSYNFKDREAVNSIGPGGNLRAYLEELAKAENVQEYIKRHPFGQGSISERSLYWPFYKKVLNKQFAVATEQRKLLPF